jgi:hypothetical protein
LNSPLIALPATDDLQVDRLPMTAAIDGMVIASSAISFLN